MPLRNLLLLPNSPIGIDEAAADPYAGYLVYDSFTDANGTALAAHTPEKDVVGGGWGNIKGTGFAIQSDALDCNGSTDQLCSIDCGQADGIRVRLENITLGHFTGVMIRDAGTAPTLACYLGLFDVDANDVSIWLCNGSYVKKAADAEVCAPGDSYNSIEIRVSGNKLTLYVDDVERCDYTDATFNAQTFVGVFGYTEDGTWDAEIFKVS